MHIARLVAAMLRRGRLPLAGLGLLAAAFGGLDGLGCRSDTSVAPRDTVPLLRDTVPPLVEVVFPATIASYDRDSNGLLDLEVHWVDTGRGGRINPATLRVVPLVGGVPGLTTDSNLVPGWRTVRLDSAGAVLEETVGQLLREGDTQLAVSVADSAGNVAVARASVRLPPGAWHGAISLAGGAGCERHRGVYFALSPDGRKGLVPYSECVAVFDPEGVAPVRFVQSVPNATFAAFITVDSAGLAYVGGGTSGFTVLDTHTEQVVRSQMVGAGVASVQVIGGRLFVGEDCTNGRVYVYDVRTLALLGQIEVGAPYANSTCPNTIQLAVRSAGTDGWGAVDNAGLAHFNPQTYAMTEMIRLDSGACGGACWAAARSIRLAGDRWLEVAVPNLGLEEFDTTPWRLNAVHMVDPYRAEPVYKELALSPDGTALFVSADSTGYPPLFQIDSVQTPLLFDVPGLRLRYAFPHRRGGLTDAAAWHPDGKRVYLIDGYHVDVYLVRPRPQ